MTRTPSVRTIFVGKSLNMTVAFLGSFTLMTPEKKSEKISFSQVDGGRRNTLYVTKTPLDVTSVINHLDFPQCAIYNAYGVQ